MAGENLEVRERIQDDNTFFKSLLDLIPARVYFDEDMKDKIRHRGSDGGSSDEDVDGPKRKKKKKEKGRRKKRTLDPLESKTVTELQEELNTNKTESTFTKIKSKKKEKTKGESREMKSVTTNMEELRQRLHARIEELKGKSGRLSSHEWMERKKLKRKESKLKLKIRRKTEKQNLTKGENSSSKAVLNGLIAPVKPVFNKDGKVVFSKFDFTDDKKKNKTPMSDLTGKDYKKILENLEKRKEKIKDLREKDEIAARDLEKKTTWQAAISKAEGVKIKDNPEQLKKALKRKEKQKEKSKSSWESRDKQVAEKQKVKQDKRQKNIQSRKQAKVDKKIKRAKKKGRVVPGF